MALSPRKPAAASWLDGFGSRAGNRDIGFALGVMAILAVLFVPLPPVLLDLGLALSFAVSVLVLMVALWVKKPLEFNSFPTLLLVVTMMRLALNIASSRLILSEGQTGSDAAGHVIEGIAQFVVGGDYIIGTVIFIILVTVNFVVITKGSTRIAEVSARFSLDAMPGKQMAIDADLGAGVIDDAEARARRKEVEQESGFFGAMDGAAKFVRGDAVAGIIITLINIVGGILIGLLRHDLPIATALQNYTVLTIGDGLVSQIPALIVSLAAGLIVTKGGTEGAASEAVIGQLGASSRALYMTAVIVFGFGLLPGFPLLLFAALAAGLAATGWWIDKAKADDKADAAREAAVSASEAAEAAEDPADLLKIDTLRLELGAALVPLIGSPDAALPGKVKSLRNLFATEYGFLLPPVRIKDNSALPAMSYALVIQGVEIARGELRPAMRLVIDPANEAADIPGTRVKEPTFGLSAFWVNAAQVPQAEARGLTVVDGESVIITHMTEAIKEHLPEMLTYGATQELIKGLDRDYQKLVSDIPNPSPVILTQHVLQNLLGERLSIRNLPLICEAVAEAAAASKNLTFITEHVRKRLASQICNALEGEDGFMRIVVPGGGWEAEFTQSTRVQGDEVSFLMAPARVQDFVAQARAELHKFAQNDEWPALLVAPEIRPIVRSMIERVSPMTQVISHNEIHRKARLRTVGTIGP
ncbi:flagellar biosynthesis protein FlhA [Pseudogemmobacter faecipullorum]|uniref:Flagellar biosynthesis protein FlhA n=1 Tax=Pseudogemmobacter faecipullorum TaxID=2755041 RepID=A0ABS8CN95_9RHOB|nr:flagellar biosynthesis protein FlhA [Pseudogemmobacter faecipullorum]MCB5410881.1 flagellar biosynthesis protein FlhA [Pseudogemmobacter faecipullorum]